MADAFYGEVRILPYTFTPRDWVPCNGQLAPISQNTALFSIIGTNYGGDGRLTMGIPNLIGRTPMGSGSAPGLTQRFLSQRGGDIGVMLSTSEIPQHSHDITNVHWDASEEKAPANTYLGRMNANLFYKSKDAVITDIVQMNPSTLSVEGASQPHENRQPFTAVQFCMCINGIFPPRN